MTLEIYVNIVVKFVNKIKNSQKTKYSQTAYFSSLSCEIPRKYLRKFTEKITTYMHLSQCIYKRQSINHSEVTLRKNKVPKLLSNKKTLFVLKPVKTVNGRSRPLNVKKCCDSGRVKVNNVQSWLEQIEKVHQNRSHLLSQREFYELVPDNNR